MSMLYAHPGMNRTYSKRLFHQAAFLLGLLLVGCDASVDDTDLWDNGVTDGTTREHFDADSVVIHACIDRALTFLPRAPDSTLASVELCWHKAESGPREALGHVYHMALSKAFYQGKDMLKALLHADSALRQAPRNVHDSTAAMALVLKCRIFLWSGDHELAAEAIARAMEHQVLSADTLGLATSHGLWGWIHFRQNQFERARAHWVHALELHRNLNHRQGIAEDLRWVGAASLHLGNVAVGHSYYDSSLALSHKIGDPELLASIHSNIGQHMDSAIYYAALTGDEGGLHRIYHTAGIHAIRQGDVAVSLRYCTKALNYARRTQNLVLERDALDCLHGSYRTVGDPRKALLYRDTAIELNDRINGQSTPETVLKQTVVSEYRRRSLGDSLRYASDLLRLEHDSAMTLLRAERDRVRAWSAGLLSLSVLALGFLFNRIDMKRRRMRHERDTARLENKALRAQMNPHFLFNALHGLHGYIQENERELATAFLARYTRLMRLVLEHSRQDEITLAEELEVQRLYLDLEQERMNGRFQHSIDVDPGIDPSLVVVPPLVVQPILENAIWHGISPKQGVGHIHVKVERDGPHLRFVVEDDGVGRVRAGHEPASGDGRTSLGTTITRERLDLIGQRHGMEANLYITDLAQGTRVEVLLPFARTG